MSPERESRSLSASEKGEMMFQDLLKELSSFDGIPSPEKAFDIAQRYVACDVLKNIDGLAWYETQILVNGESEKEDYFQHVRYVYHAFNDAKIGDWKSAKRLTHANLKIIEKLYPIEEGKHPLAHFFNRKINQIMQSIPDKGEPLNMSLLNTTS